MAVIFVMAARQDGGSCLRFILLSCLMLKTFNEGFKVNHSNLDVGFVGIFCLD